MKVEFHNDFIKCSTHLINSNIFVCITSNIIWTLYMNDKSNVWNQYQNIKVPIQNITPMILLCYHEVLVIFYGNLVDASNTEIWCLDMIEHQWYKSKKICHENCLLLHKNWIATDTRYCYYYNDNKQQHYRIDLFDAYPKELQDKVMERTTIKNLKICFGYCRTNERRLKLIMPDYLKRIVFRYYYYNDI